MAVAAIHQFHSGTAIGDAITDQMLFLQRLLRSDGYVSEIFAEHLVGGSLENRIRPIEAYEDRPSTLLLVHHSIGHTAFERVTSIRSPIVTVFHSITPPQYFNDPQLRTSIRVGFDQLRQLASRSVLGIADSNHNRRQMLDAGFERVDVLPVRTDYSEFHGLRADRTHLTNGWLFVGRVVPNKRQLDVIAAFASYQRAFCDSHLHLVGDISYQPYAEAVRDAVKDLGVLGHVTMHGKVSHADLLAIYRDSGVFVCLSEHEGFGVPILEAMAAGLPVIALRAAAVPETMGGAGILVDHADPSTVAAVTRLLLTDADLRSRVVESQIRRLSKLEDFDVRGLLHRIADVATTGSRRPVHVQIQGPFETSYSLAALNRELALELDRMGLCVTIYATEGPGDYQPSQRDLAIYPRASEMYEAGKRHPFPDVAIRQMYPPRVDDSDAAVTFQYFGWEESGIPPHIVTEFNQHLDGIGTMSTYVREILVGAGVVVPIEVVGVGVHQPDPNARVDAPELSEMRATRLLHISSAFPRKGVDILLRAYYEAFTSTDEVSLILKTFPNPHNDINRILNDLSGEFHNPPHVCWIDRDMTRAEIDGLYVLAHGYVHPARGEGFGLPVAEAMLASVPVISVHATGLSDLVRPDTAAVIGHELRPATSHLSTPNSTWAEPSGVDLARELRSLIDGEDAERRSLRVRAGRELVRSEYTWQRVAERWKTFVDRTLDQRTGRDVVAVTTFNSKCGIAEYSARLYGHMGAWTKPEIHADVGAVPLDSELEHCVHRTWNNYRSGPVDRLLEQLDASTADLTHIQYNMGFFAISELGRLLRHETSRRPTVLTLHRTAPLTREGRTESLADIAGELRLCGTIIVHQELDRQRLAEIDIADNVRVLSIGTEPSADIEIQDSRRRHNVPSHAFVIGTYGFLLPHKGLLISIQALGELRARGIDAFLLACCAMHPADESATYVIAVRAEIERLGLAGDVLLVTEYLENHESLDLLAAADVLVLAYEHTDESASAAIRSILPLSRPIVTSDAQIFDDVRHCVRQLPTPINPVSLADDLENLWLDPNELNRLAAAVKRFSVSNAWPRVSRLTRDIYSALISDDRQKNGSVSSRSRR